MCFPWAVDGADGMATPRFASPARPGPSIPSIRASHRHPPQQHRTAADVRTRIDVATHRLDGEEHLAQVAGDGDAVDRMHDLPVLDQEAGRAARVVAGHGV